MAAIVTVGLETGLRRGELLGLTWDRVDLSRGVLRLEITKSGKRREVPIRQPVYDILAAMPEPRQGRVWRVKNTRTAFESAVTRAGTGITDTISPARSSCAVAAYRRSRRSSATPA